MAKNAITDYSTTAINNTDVGGINIDEGCAPANINNALREIMAHLAAYIDAAVMDALTVSSSAPNINITNTGSGMDSRITVGNVDGATSLIVDADLNGETANTQILFRIDGTAYFNMRSDGFRLPTIAAASLPAAGTSNAGAMIYVPDDAAGACIGVSDGSTWRKLTLGGAISA